MDTTEHEMSTLLADIAKAKTRVDKAEAALERAEEERARGHRDEVSACRQMLIESQKTLNLLLEMEKRLAAEREAGERAGGVADSVLLLASADGERSPLLYYKFPFYF